MGFVIVAVMSLLALPAPLIAPQKPGEPDFASLLVPMSGAHQFGTDQLGRDVLTRVIYGGRISFSVGLSARSAAASSPRCSVLQPAILLEAPTPSSCVSWLECSRSRD